MAARRLLRSSAGSARAWARAGRRHAAGALSREPRRQVRRRRSASQRHPPGGASACDTGAGDGGDSGARTHTVARGWSAREQARRSRERARRARVRPAERAGTRRASRELGRGVPSGDQLGDRAVRARPLLARSRLPGSRGPASVWNHCPSSDAYIARKSDVLSRFSFGSSFARPGELADHFALHAACRSGTPTPAAPWSVPEPFSCGRRPNSDHSWMSTRSCDPARLEVALEGEHRFDRLRRGWCASVLASSECVS